MSLGAFDIQTTFLMAFIVNAKKCEFVIGNQQWLIQFPENKILAIFKLQLNIALIMSCTWVVLVSVPTRTRFQVKPDRSPNTLRQHDELLHIM